MPSERPLPQPLDAASLQQLEAQRAAWRTMWRRLLIKRDERETASEQPSRQAA